MTCNKPWIVEELRLSQETMSLFQEFSMSGAWPELRINAQARVELAWLEMHPGRQLPSKYHYYGILEGSKLSARMMLETSHMDHTIYLHGVEVLCEFQGEGRGSALVCKAKQLAADLRYDIFLLAGISPRSVSFFKKHGFEVSGDNPEGESVPMSWSPGGANASIGT